MQWERDNDLMEYSRFCPQQQLLLKSVQKHLIRIATLSSAATDALINRNESLLRRLDRQVEDEVGEKDLACGALRQHREEHGC